MLHAGCLSVLLLVLDDLWDLAIDFVLVAWGLGHHVLGRLLIAISEPRCSLNYLEKLDCLVLSVRIPSLLEDSM